MGVSGQTFVDGEMVEPQRQVLLSAPGLRPLQITGAAAGFFSSAGP